MSKNKSKKTTTIITKPDNQCPECKFSGNEKFRKGFAAEKHSVVKEDKIIQIQIKRCPVCGHQERSE